MNWGKAKSVLIVLFVCADLFLLSIILFFSGDVKQTPGDIVAAASEIIKNGGITVDERFLKEKSSEVYVPELESVTKIPEEFAAKLLGEIRSEENGTFSGERGELSIDGKYFEFTPSEQILLSSKNSASSAKKILKLLGINDKNIVSETKGAGDNCILHISAQIDGMYLFGSEIDVSFSERGVKKISGCWFSETGNLSDETATKPISGLLVNYALHNADGQKTITDILPGYLIGESAPPQSAFFPSPCIKIIFSNGNTEYIFSAENAVK